MHPRQFKMLQQFILNSLSTYKIDGDNVRISIAQFPGQSSTTSYQYYQNRYELIDLVKNLKRQSNGLDLAGITEKSINDLVILSGNKQNPKVFVFVLHQSVNALDLAAMEKAINSLRSQNVRIVIVYIGQRDVINLQRIVGNPGQVIQIDWSNLLNGIGSLEQQIGLTGGEFSKSDFVRIFNTLKRTMNMQMVRKALYPIANFLASCTIFCN